MARTFNGTSDLITAGSGAVLTAAPISVSIWYYPTSSGHDQELFCIGDNSGGSFADAFRLECNWTLSGTNLLGFTARHGGTDGGSGTATAAPNLNQWNHIAGTISGVGGAQITYLNGVQVASNTSAVGAPTGLSHTTVGVYYFGSGGGPGNFTQGRLADCAVWNVVLTPAEIAALAAGVRPIQVRPNALKLWLPLDGIQSPEPDLSGFLNNGTLTGTSSGFGPPVTMFTPRWPQLVPPPPVTTPPPYAYDWPLPYRAQPGNIDLRGGSRGTPSNFITPTGTPPKGQYDWPVPRAPERYVYRFERGDTALLFPPIFPFHQHDWPVPQGPLPTLQLGRPQGLLPQFIPPLGQPPNAYYDWPVPKAATPGAIDLRWAGQGTPLTMFPVQQVQPFNQYAWPVPGSYLSSVDLKTFNQSLALTINPTGTLMGAMWM